MFSYTQLLFALSGFMLTVFIVVILFVIAIRYKIGWFKNLFIPKYSAGQKLFYIASKRLLRCQVVGINTRRSKIVNRTTYKIEIQGESDWKGRFLVVPGFYLRTYNELVEMRKHYNRMNWLKRLSKMKFIDKKMRTSEVL